MNTIKRSITSAVIVIISLTFIISVFYAAIIPMLAPNYKTYYVLAAGVAISALAGGYIGYQSPTDDAALIKISFGFFYAIATSTLVFLFSLFIILNIRGA